jgi:hypothetical protein
MYSNIYCHTLEVNGTLSAQSTMNDLTKETLTMPCPRLPFLRCPHASRIAILALILGGSTGMAHAESASAAPASAAEIQGQYALADGRLLTITGNGRKIRAQLDGRATTVLVSAGGAVFDAADGSFRLRFEQHQNGNVTAVELEEKPAN